MDNLARHMRISGISVSDSDVESRQAAVRNLVASWGKDKDPESIVSTAADIAEALGGDGTPSPELGKKVQTSIQKKSPSFLHDERPLDIGICSGMAMVSILSGPSTDGWIIKDIYATALWLALSYQPVLQDGRREHLRQEVLDKASNWYATSVEKARKRVDVPEPSAVEISIDDDNAISNNVTEAMNNTLDALRHNAALDREELDFLWWVQLGRSRLLKKQLSEIDEPVRIVASGIEAAQILRRLPCEVHREIVLRTLAQNPELDLRELLAAIDGDRTVLGSAFMESNVLAHPTVFPFLHALSTGEPDQISPSLKRPVSEWGERALLEATFAKMMSQGVGII